MKTLLILFLPEPIYTIVMALTGLGLVILFCLFMYKLCLRVLGSDFMEQQYEEAGNEDISHLHREYYVEEGGKKYTISTNADGYVKSISGNNQKLEPIMPVRLVEEGTTCRLTTNGKVIREFELAIKD